ncbi:tetratricopeptide repeat protein [Ectothiorhodospira haloalkaliphila]|uniref:class I SAM-dependent methyltransferase n=1 Tax=Ectothiorhodospira haloalkaliphila TaxID=421628 RepID=UPI001EE83481|nr:class I SAM-dependent methyltransferase [Ectothiorhodospira haloalkaliphila]MCG5524765.1 tetratricopeptide repeat protein [Ectothiorhodospira haloalkaliphila]
MGALQAALNRHSVHLATSIAARLVEAYPDNPQLLQALGHCLCLRGNDQAALGFLKQALEKKPTDAAIRFNLVIAQLWAGQSQEAQHTLHGLPESLWTHPRFMQLAVEIFLASDDRRPETVRDALALCEQLLQGQANHPEKLLLKGQVLSEAGDLDLALTVFERAWQVLEAQPTSADAPVLSPLATRLLYHWAEALGRQAPEDAERVCDMLWRACEQRPYSRFTARAWDDLQTWIGRSPAPQHASVATLHERIRSIWAQYGGEQLTTSFGDFGLPYQGFEPLWLPGTRPTRARLAIYGLDEVLPEHARALDIGCNHGYLLVGLGERLSQGDGFDISQACVDVGNEVAAFMGHDHIRLWQDTFESFISGESGEYDLVIACAVHHWIGMPLDAFGEHLYRLCRPGGVVLLESQGRRRTDLGEEGFADKVRCVEQAGFETIRQGDLCDDAVNYREFRLLRRRG